MFSPDGRLVVTSSNDGTARIWDVQTGSLVKTLEGHNNIVSTAVFSRSGNLIVTASTDHDARIWSVSDGRTKATLKGHTGAVNSAAFSPDERLVVTASDDKTARLWDGRSGRYLRELNGHSGEVVSARFSGDSARVITASADNNARVWDAGTGKLLFELRGHINKVNNAALNRDGSLAATASEDNTARTWDITGAGGIRVINVSVRALPDDYAGDCPVRVSFSAKITAVGSGAIKYRFVRKGVRNGAGPEREVVFESSGSKDVNSTWLFGGKRFPNPSGSFYLEIISPQPLASTEASYSIKCQFPADAKELEVPPSTPLPTPEN